MYFLKKKEFKRDDFVTIKKNSQNIYIKSIKIVVTNEKICDII